MKWRLALLMLMVCLPTLAGSASPATAETTVKLTVGWVGEGGGQVITVGPADTIDSIECRFQDVGTDWCSGLYPLGTTVTLEARDDDDLSVFLGWSGCTTKSGFTCTVSMDRNRTVKATFKKKSDLAVGIAEAADPLDTDGSGAEITYTTTALNRGPYAAKSVKVIQTLPKNASYVSASPNKGSCSANSTNPIKVTCSLGELTSGSSNAWTIRIVARLQGQGQLTTTASISSSLNFDHIPGNNNGKAVTTALGEYTEQ